MIENPLIMDRLITFLIVATIASSPISCSNIPVKTSAAIIKKLSESAVLYELV